MILPLCRPGQSQLLTSTMLWRASGLSSLDDYLNSSLGMQKSLFPTVLGVKLAEDLDLGRRFESCDLTNINELIRNFSSVTLHRFNFSRFNAFFYSSLPS